MRSLVGLFLCFALALAGCGPASEDGDFGAMSDDGEALATTFQGHRLELVAGVRSGKIVFTGTAASLQGARAFVPDDEVGSTAITRTGFTSTFAPREVTGFVEGQPMFVSLDFGGTGTAHSLVARADVRAMVSKRSGSTSLAPRPWFQTFAIGGQSMVRVRGNAPAAVSSVKATVEGQSLTGRGAAKEWVLDVPVQAFLSSVAAKHALSLTVVAGGKSYRTGFQPQLAVARLVLAAGDAYELWPAPTCTEALKSCLAGAGNDTSACGDAWTVRFCPAPASGSDAAGFIDAAAEELSADYLPAYQRILGATRGNALHDAVIVKARGQASALAGLSGAAALAKAKELVKALFQEALVHPLRFVAPTANVPHDEANARVVALEALVLKLESMDLSQTEFGRSLEEIVAASPESWIGGLENLRNASNGTVVENTGAAWVVEGRVLGAYVEVEVAQATGVATRVLFEID